MVVNVLVWFVGVTFLGGGFYRGGGVERRGYFFPWRGWLVSWFPFDVVQIEAPSCRYDQGIPSFLFHVTPRTKESQWGLHGDCTGERLADGTACQHLTHCSEPLLRFTKGSKFRSECDDKSKTWCAFPASAFRLTDSNPTSSRSFASLLLLLMIELSFPTPPSLSTLRKWI